MKTLIFISLSLLLSLCAFAYESEEVCAGRMSERQRRKCVREIDKGSYFDSQAIRLCGSMLSYNPRLHCIRTIRDHSYDRFVVSFCNDMRAESKKVECLNISKDKIYDGMAIGECRRQTVGYFTHDANKLHCLRRATNQRR